MSDAIKVAVVGVGQFGQNHARVYHELPQAELVGVYDIDSGRAEAIAKGHGCRAFGSIEELFGQVQAASIAVPTVDHAAVAGRLLDAGVDVLVEKPFARTVAEADQMIATAERHKLGVVSDFQAAQDLPEGTLDTNRNETVRPSS